MQVIALTGVRRFSVTRADRSPIVFLTVDATRDEKDSDPDTRLRISLPAAQAGELWRLLGNVLSYDEKVTG